MDIEFDVADAGLGGHDAGEAPVDGSEAADEVQLGFVDGLETANEGLEEVWKASLFSPRRTQASLA
ncbi:MAG: hypothetical protein LLG20_12100 [Acidobacteriales bacterium]|nr:hypothetical protein [Terriglobales bacterium]